MVKVHRLTGTLITILAFVVFTSAFISQEQTNPRLITAIPPVQTAPLLQPDKHIRHTPRPIDNYIYPIPLGETGPLLPLFSGDLQYPFICMTEESGFQQPLVDNQHGWGMPVFKSRSDRDNRNNIIGYSKDCQIPTGLVYYLIDQNNKISRYKGQPLHQNEQLVRIEYGVIHRYIYLIAMPIQRSEINKREAKSQWNQKLVYQFTGGAGIGFRQGSMQPHKLIERRVNQLKAGYAVITSGANRTSFTYNMLLSEDTARRLKKHFISLYGEPVYTVGVGGSGGGLAQYLMAQNAPGLIDGAIPLYSYPDMVSQALYALDCDLLNSYYTFKAKDRDFWQDWSKRPAIEGLNANNGEPHKGAFFQPINQALNGLMPSYPKGNSECINGWFGLYAFIHNPKQGWLRDYVSENLQQHVHWSYWQDLVNIYGKDDKGYARHIWGNEGVQYGLNALKQGQISLEQFIDLNQKIGSWKDDYQMQPERVASVPFANIKVWLSLWGHHNINEPDANQVAKRQPTDHKAVENAYRYGQIFAGKADLPILDVRHYLEDQFDMHHVSASFSARMRMKTLAGHADNQIIWVAHPDYNPVDLAFKTMDTWLLNMLDGQEMLDAKPTGLADACFDAKGQTIASGNSVWDGPWNQAENGICSDNFKVFSTSRIQAGANWLGDTFDCHRVSVEQAAHAGMYGEIDVSPVITQLKQIFPTGVCDYNQPGIAKPTDLALN
ncbi:DUF6351 family protein [Catenovulum sediminis]|uniref:DUF6351 family protein n=1 Tax=Catenovulum sediminis TaxID=1740262 RepID=A0ABV1RBR0_9ALTE